MLCSAGTARSNIAVEFCWVWEGVGKSSKHEWLNDHFGSSVCLCFSRPPTPIFFKLRWEGSVQSVLWVVVSLRRTTLRLQASLHSRVMLPSHRSVRCMLATSIHLPGTVAHLKLVCVRERKNRPSSSCMFCSRPFDLSC